MSVNKKMTAIADAIREKTGGTEALTLDDMALAVPKVFDGGKKAEYDEFWASAEKSTTYSYRFAGACWNDETFKPTKSINFAGNCVGAFSGNTTVHFKEALALNNVKYDFSGATSATNLFSYANAEELPEINLSKCTSGINGVFLSCSKLTKIDSITFASTLGTATNVFQNCKALKEIRITNCEENGNAIRANGLNFKDCTELSIESLRSILNSLTKNSTLANGKAITFYTSHQAKIANDAECSAYASAATSAGWTIAYNS